MCVNTYISGRELKEPRARNVPPRETTTGDDHSDHTHTSERAESGRVRRSVTRRRPKNIVYIDYTSWCRPAVPGLIRAVPCTHVTRRRDTRVTHVSHTPTRLHTRVLCNVCGVRCPLSPTHAPGQPLHNLMKRERYLLPIVVASIVLQHEDPFAICSRADGKPTFQTRARHCPLVAAQPQACYRVPPEQRCRPTSALGPFPRDSTGDAPLLATCQGRSGVSDSVA